MRVDGKEGLACVTKVAEGDEIMVEPLANLPVVSDLVVDMDVFYDELRRAPAARWSGPPRRSPAPRRPRASTSYTRYEDCIECGICLSACPIAGTDPRYVGPAALAAAWRVVEEPRGRHPAPSSRLMDDEQAVWRCHVAWECSEACPSGVDPAGAIMRMRARPSRRARDASSGSEGQADGHHDRRASVRRPARPSGAASPAGSTRAAGAWAASPSPSTGSRGSASSSISISTW